MTQDSVTVYFKQPETNGAEITGYSLEYSSGGSKGTAAPVGSATGSPQAVQKLTLQGLMADGEGNLEYTVEGLRADTMYRFKLRALNAVGCSGYSTTSKVETLPLPPAPPAIECVGVAQDSLKLKWGEGRNVDFLCYYVDMAHSRSREYANVYLGSNFTCKVNKLAELTTYKFRIRAKADRADMGPYSEDYLFQTAAAKPQGIKPPRVYFPVAAADELEVEREREAESQLVNHVNVEWQHSKNTFADPVEYILQIKRNGKGQEFAQVGIDDREGDWVAFVIKFPYFQVYGGPETKHLIENLECGVEYVMRVCPVRMMRRQQQQQKTAAGGVGRSSRSSSSSQEGEEVMVVETNDCDNDYVEELMGQWSKLLSYVVLSRQEAKTGNGSSSGGVGNGSEGNGTGKHIHIHHPHSHHQHYHLSASPSSSSSPPPVKCSTTARETTRVLALDALRALFSSRHMSDAERAMVFAFVFMLVAIALAICVNYFL